jgi:hypothetical protein
LGWEVVLASSFFSVFSFSLAIKAAPTVGGGVGGGGLWEGNVAWRKYTKKCSISKKYNTVFDVGKKTWTSIDPISSVIGLLQHTQNFISLLHGQHI